MYAPLITAGWPDWYLRKSRSSYKTSSLGECAEKKWGGGDPTKLMEHYVGDTSFLGQGGGGVYRRRQGDYN